jgi:tight adherence protein B
MMFGEGVLIFVALVFVAVFLLAQGMTVPVFGENRQAAKRLKHRLAQLERFDDGDAEIASLLRERSMKHLAPWERALESLPFLRPLSEHIRQSGNDLPAYRLVLLSAALAVVAGFIAWQLLRSEEIVLAAGAIGAALPFLKISSDRRKRFAQLEEQLPEAIDVMQRALKAGHPFNGTLKLVAEDMDGPIAREFELTFADINYGNDVRRAMLGLLARVPSITVMALVTSVLVQKETGGNLAEILKQLSAVVRSRFQLQRRVRTLSAEGRMSAWVLAMVPLVLVVLLSISSPDYLPVLFSDPTGQKLVAFAAVWGAIGIYLLRRIIRINV